MFLFIKTFDRTISIEADRTSSIDEIKFIIEQKEGIPISDQRLIYGGKQLENRLCDYDIKNGRFLFGICNI